MKQRRNVGLGPSLVAAIDAFVLANGSARSEEVVRLVDLGLSAKRQPPLRTDCYLSENTRSEDGGTVTVYASSSWWSGIDERARRYGENISESVRALIHGGLTIGDSAPPVRESIERVEAAMGHRAWRPGELAREVWGEAHALAFSGHSGAYAVRRALDLLEASGRVFRALDGKWERGAKPSAR